MERTRDRGCVTYRTLLKWGQRSTRTSPVILQLASFGTLENCPRLADSYLSPTVIRLVSSAQVKARADVPLSDPLLRIESVPRFVDTGLPVSLRAPIVAKTGFADRFSTLEDAGLEQPRAT